MATNMESVHGVDVSWLHHPQKENHGRTRAVSSPAPVAIPATRAQEEQKQKPEPQLSVDTSKATPTKSPQIKQDRTNPSGHSPKLPNSPIPPYSTDSTQSKSAPRRPNLLNRTASQEKLQGDQAKSPRRPSWINNISSKFSSQSQQQLQSGPPSQQQPPSSLSPSQPSKPQVTSTNATSSPRPDQPTSQPGKQAGYKVEAEELQPYVPQKPKESGGSFFSSLTRRLSSNSQGGPAGKMSEAGGVCPRRVLNVDPNRERCLVPELDAAKLRRVSFSVDVEIAAGPKYRDDDATVAKSTKSKDNKMKERAEGEALKHPQAVTDVKEEKAGDQTSVDKAVAKDVASPEVKMDEDAQAAALSDPKASSHKKDRKKKSEEERKERKEKKRRKAEENGSVPVELTRDDDSSKEDSPTTQSPSTPTSTAPKIQENPTTDPVRIYRRCCQLRESPILKRITEQLMSPTCTLPNEPGTVTVLNLTGSRLQLADFVTLGDWLAIVPVRRLILEDADITDEGVRVVLAGLLSSKKPQPTKLRKGAEASNGPREERTGIVEKLNLKNNPRMTRSSWKHIALFLYMCRSIKAVDLSMNQFPDNLPPSATNTPVKAPERNSVSTGHDVDAAETFSKALAERLGGSTLEELNLSECGLSTAQLRKILDGATMSGLSRLSLAGNYLDDEGFEHVLSYIRSGLCNAIDIGSNDFRGKLSKLAEALTHNPDCPIWGLSLVNCNLDTETLRAFLPALTRLKDFKFLDISHNKELFERDAAGGIHLLRKYIPKLRNLIRLHLLDVGLSAKQAIALAEVLPEGPRLAHFNILENADITALASRTDEVSQEEACALYASLMAAARVSPALVCIDVDVPSNENSEVVKALAKQVVAYTLRNMERMPLTQNLNAVIEQTKQNGEKERDEIMVPDVLLHLVGHVDGFNENHDSDDPAPDDDYIVGGNGVVKALQYCLGETSQSLRRGSGTASGITTPKDRDSALGGETAKKGKAKEMSKSLLDSARKIRARLRPALLKEAAAGDEMAYRRLMFLDSTLERMIGRFEDEFPETRVEPASPRQTASLASSANTLESTPLTDAMSSTTGSLPSHPTDPSSLTDEDDEDMRVSPRPSRHNSDVNIASRALALEEGRIHRLGQGLRRDIMNAPSSSSSSALDTTATDFATTSTIHTSVGDATPYNATTASDDATEAHLVDLSKRIEAIDGPDLRDMVEHGGWPQVMEKIGANIEELRQLQEKDPIGWEQFKESQMKATLNVGGRDGRR